MEKMLRKCNVANISGRYEAGIEKNRKVEQIFLYI